MLRRPQKIMASFGWGSHNHVHYACRSAGENVFSISLEPNGNEKQEVHPTGKSSGEGGRVCVCVCVGGGGGDSKSDADW